MILFGWKRLIKMQTNFDIPFKNIVEFGQQTMLDNKLFSVLLALCT